MGIKLWDVVCGENGIDGSGDYCSDNDSHLDHIYEFYHEPLGGKYVPRAVLFDLERGLIGAVALSQRSASSSARETS
jgi:tubulin beta